MQRGQHEELLREGGLYREIYDLQLRDQERLRRELMEMGGLIEGAGRRRKVRLSGEGLFGGVSA